MIENIHYSKCCVDLNGIPCSVDLVGIRQGDYFSVILLEEKIMYNFIFEFHVKMEFVIIVTLNSNLFEIRTSNLIMIKTSNLAMIRILNLIVIEIYLN